MPVVRYELTGDPDTPVLMFADDLPLLDESVMASAMAEDIGARTLPGYMSAVLWALRAAHAFDSETGRAKLIAEARRARQFVNRMLRESGCKLRRLRGRGGYSVKNAEQQGSIEARLTALRKFVDQGFELGLMHGQRPFELDGWRGLSDAARALIRSRSPETAASQGKFKVDTGRYYRTPYCEWVPPRTSDVRWLTEILRVLKEGGKGEYLTLPVEAAGCTGGRIGEILDFNAWGWFKYSQFGPEIGLRNKRQGDLERKRQALSTVCHAKLEKWFDGWRHDHDPRAYTMEKLRDLGRRYRSGSKEEKQAIKAELRSIRIFINSRGDGLTYANLTDHVRPLLRKAGIPATLHWIRHEYVFRRLREIDAMNCSRILWDAERKALADYMGWASGVAMFEVYDAYERARAAHAGAAGFAERLEEEVTASQQLEVDPDVNPVVVPLTHEERCADLQDFLNHSFRAPANDDLPFANVA